MCKVIVSYLPFGNAKVAPITMDFNLSIKSEIFEGSLKYIPGKTFEVGSGTSATLKLADFIVTDVYGVKYQCTV